MKLSPVELFHLVLLSLQRVAYTDSVLLQQDTPGFVSIRYSCSYIAPSGDLFDSSIPTNMNESLAVISTPYVVVKSHARFLSFLLLILKRIPYQGWCNYLSISN
jgi:hypothetical protein